MSPICVVVVFAPWQNKSPVQHSPSDIFVGSVPRPRSQASSEHSISVAIDAAGAAGAKKVTREAFSSEIRHGTVAVDVIRQAAAVLFFVSAK